MARGPSPTPAGARGTVAKTDRDVLAEWLGEELAASTRNGADARAVHQARSAFYLDMLRGALDGPPPRRTECAAAR